ncbi:MAG: FtsX-like permease family protein, partial [bacterium]
LTLAEYKKINYLQEVIISSLKVLQVIMIIASISIALIASTNTILITTFERIPEFTIILAIGSPRIIIFLTILIESLFLSLVSSLIGLTLGIITTTLVASSIQSALNISIPLMANAHLVSQQVILISILIGLISSIVPAYIASTIDITSTIRQIN